MWKCFLAKLFKEIVLQGWWCGSWVLTKDSRKNHRLFLFSHITKKSKPLGSSDRPLNLVWGFSWVLWRDTGLNSPPDELWGSDPGPGLGALCSLIRPRLFPDLPSFKMKTDWRNSSPPPEGIMKQSWILNPVCVAAGCRNKDTSCSRSYLSTLCVFVSVCLNRLVAPRHPVRCHRAYFQDPPSYCL